MEKQKRVTLSSDRKQKLHDDISDVIMDTRIQVQKLWPFDNKDQLDSLLFKMQLKATERANQSLEETL